MITEGGNVFKDAQGAPRTQRINLADIPATVAWLEKITGIELKSNMLGTTGQKPTSGDLDLGIDSNTVNKDQFTKHLQDYVAKNGQNPQDWVRKSGTSVHFLTPIAGRADRGFVQTDFMFVPKMEWAKFMLAGSPLDSAYKGASRNILINSIGKALGYKLNQNAGLMDRATNDLITDDPDEIAQMLLNPKATRRDLRSVESILAVLKTDPQRDAKLADFRDHMAREGTPIDESVDTDVNFLARLRDRIVNQGMVPIMEGVRIEHPEDLAFEQRPSAGLQRALASIQALAQDPGSVTVKWDGKPAIVFGRNPRGEFVLTDKSGFLARGYDGLATSPEDIERIMARRGGERGELIEVYKKLFPLLRRAVPQSFRGYIQGDLLYSQRPPQRNGVWEFTPNTVTYRVAVDSDIGRKIAASDAAVVIHTALSEPGAPGQPIRAAALTDNPGLLILDPSLREIRDIQLDPRVLKDVQRLIQQYGTAMDRLFDPAELRARKISTLPALMKTYINSRVRSGSYDNLVRDFGTFVQQREPTKAPRIFEWATENRQAVAALFQAFLEISSLKNSIVRQLDSQAHDVQAAINDEPGHEGYVGQGLKFVDRMRFSQANFARNNPELAN
jgi:hypothetical protein